MDMQEGKEVASENTCNVIQIDYGFSYVIDAFLSFIVFPPLNRRNGFCYL